MKLFHLLIAAISFLLLSTIPAAETPGAAISIVCTDPIKILDLEVGQPRLYDSKPLRVIERMPGNLTGWQFTSIPQRVIISYKIRVNRDGVLYAFGGGSTKHPPTRKEFLGDDASQWSEEKGAIGGINIPSCFRRKVTAGETISLHSFELSLAAEGIALEDTSGQSPAASRLSATDGKQSPTEVLAKQAPNAMEWVLAPLDRAVPEDIRQNLMLLREDLRDEEAKKPAANAAPYNLGQELCKQLIATLNERDLARVRVGYVAAQAKANMGEITNQALEARRTAAVGKGMAWPTYRREKDQREEVRRQKENGAALENQRPILEWADRSTAIRKDLDTLYAQFREAVRRPVAAP